LIPEQKKRLKAKIAVDLQGELGRVPQEAEINQVFLLTRVMYKAALGCISDDRNKRNPDNSLSS